MSTTNFRQEEEESDFSYLDDNHNDDDDDDDDGDDDDDTDSLTQRQRHLSLLPFLIHCQNVDAIHRLLDICCCSPKDLNSYYCRQTTTPLYKAVVSEQVEIVELLLRYGANPNIASHYNRTTATTTSTTSTTSSTTTTRSNNNRGNRDEGDKVQVVGGATMLHVVSNLWDDEGDEVEDCSTSRLSAATTSTTATSTIAPGSIRCRILELLIQYGANPNKKDRYQNGNTPLCNAIQGCRADMVKWLLLPRAPAINGSDGGAGADPNKGGSDGRPLELAISNYIQEYQKHADRKKLQQKGYQYPVTMTDYKNSRIRRRKLLNVIIPSLLEHDELLINNDDALEDIGGGKTALGRAAATGVDPLVRLLLEYGVDPMYYYNGGGGCDITTGGIERGNESHGDGAMTTRTTTTSIQQCNEPPPLEVSIQGGHYKCTQLLLDYGAVPISRANKHGHSYCSGHRSDYRAPLLLQAFENSGRVTTTTTRTTRSLDNNEMSKIARTK